ncbi:MAG: CPBP family intramembrane metalloprotease, partial [Bacteroidetes bacterium]|nr:CPBP family intramembrane metalloprotease [Bacteroidota bacterium]
AVFGSGLIEEVLYRGFLLTQVYLIAVRRQVNARAALVLAAGVSSLYFGINHFPAGMRMGLDMQGLMMYVGHVSLVGLLFATLYLRTGNLFVAAGAHALINQPTTLFAAPVDPALIVLVGVACLLLIWPTLNRRIGLVFTIGAVEGRPAI